MRRARLALTAVAVLAAAPAAAAPRTTARVVAVTRETAYLDAGAGDGLAAGASFTAAVGATTRGFRITAVTRHGAVIAANDGGPPPARGTELPLPPDLAPPPAGPGPRPRPAATQPWSDDFAAGVVPAIRRAASRRQPGPGKDTTGTRVRGELTLSLLAAADLDNSSTSWQDLAIASQLQIESGSWRYDHVLEARAAGAPEIFFAPLQHASIGLEVYRLRLAWAPRGSALSAALGRQNAAPLGELGLVDGVRTQLALHRQFEATAFAGLRTATDLGVTAAPRAGLDLGWRRPGPWRLRADLGIAADGWSGGLDRATTAAALTAASRALVVTGDAVVDLASDTDGAGGPHLTRAAARARHRRGRLSVGAAAGYDEPFRSRALV